MTKKAISITALDHQKASENPHEFEYMTPAGEPTGFHVKVIGQQSETFAKLDSAIQKDYLMDQKGKTADEFQRSEKGVEKFHRQIAARIVGWRGAQEDYSPDNAMFLCSRNTHFAAQVLAASNDISNFTKL